MTSITFGLPGLTTALVVGLLLGVGIGIRTMIPIKTVELPQEVEDDESLYQRIIGRTGLSFLLYSIYSSSLHNFRKRHHAALYHSDIDLKWNEPGTANAGWRGAVETRLRTSPNQQGYERVVVRPNAHETKTAALKELETCIPQRLQNLSGFVDVDPQQSQANTSGTQHAQPDHSFGLNRGGPYTGRAAPAQPLRSSRQEAQQSQFGHPESHSESYTEARSNQVHQSGQGGFILASVHGSDGNPAETQ